jgi:hypothetical protein
MKARRLILALFSSAGLFLAGRSVWALSQVGQHCGGNISNPPTCAAGLECVPDPSLSGYPFGDVGGICAQVCQTSGTTPACDSGTCVPDPFGKASGVCQVASTAVPVPRAAVAAVGLLFAVVALRSVAAKRQL